MCFVYLTEPGTQLSKRGGTYVVTKEDERLYSIPAETIEGIVLLGSVQISSQAAADLLRRQIPAYWLTGLLAKVSTVAVFSRLPVSKCLNSRNRCFYKRALFL